MVLLKCPRAGCNNVWKYKGKNKLFAVCSLCHTTVWIKKNQVKGGDKNGSKFNKSIANYLEYTFEDFVRHIESKFESWMTWDNYGNPKDGILELNKTWDIDHIIPLSSAKTEDDVFRLNHFSNQRPLCSYYNR